jgi:acetyltransferase-like isoleucine patch superfamily enzyme
VTPLRLLTELLRGLFEWFLTPLPGPAGYALRWLYYKAILGSLGWGTLIDTGVRFENPRAIHIGRRCWIDRGVLILGAVRDPFRGRPGRWVRRDASLEGRVVIGDEVHIGPHCVLSGLAGLRIGHRLTLATGTRVYSFSHHPRNLDTGELALFTSRAPAASQFLVAGPIEIGDHSGVGFNGVILPGSTLAAESFLSVGSVLRGDTEPGWIYDGNPATRTRRRSDA